MMPLQNQEWCGLGMQSWIVEWGKYLALKVLEIKDWGFFDLILQNYLANVDWFIMLNFFKPNPPSLLGLQILSQLRRCIFLVFGSYPHQKALKMASILLQMDSRTLKQENV